MAAHISSKEAKRNKENVRRIIEINKKRQEILKQEKRTEREKNIKV